MAIKEEVVETAIYAQLIAENKQPNPAKTMAEHRYEPFEFGLFVGNLKLRLQAGQPHYYFNYDDKFLDDQLSARLAAFVMAVDRNTTDKTS